MKKNKEARDAYVEAEITTALAHQIRAMRLDRNLSQAELAKQMKTTQTAISRLEDPSYGQLSLQTLFKLSSAFDTGLRVEFVSTIAMLAATYKPNEVARHVPSFEDEANDVVFYTTAHRLEGQSTLTLPAKTLSVHNTAILAESYAKSNWRTDYLTQLTVNLDESRDNHNDFFYTQTTSETATYFTS
jgi:transcriptional regulator with XRE-family HTH domain